MGQRQPPHRIGREYRALRVRRDGDGDSIRSEQVEGDSSDNESVDVLASPEVTPLIPVEESRKFIVGTEGAQHRPRLSSFRWPNLHGLTSSLNLILKKREKGKGEVGQGG